MADMLLIAEEGGAFLGITYDERTLAITHVWTKNPSSTPVKFLFHGDETKKGSRLAQKQETENTLINVSGFNFKLKKGSEGDLSLPFSVGMNWKV